jgi:hypothetical protein
VKTASAAAAAAGARVAAAPEATEPDETTLAEKGKALSVAHLLVRGGMGIAPFARTPLSFVRRILIWVENCRTECRGHALVVPAAVVAFHGPRGDGDGDRDVRPRG